MKIVSEEIKKFFVDTFVVFLYLCGARSPRPYGGVDLLCDQQFACRSEVACGE